MMQDINDPEPTSTNFVSQTKKHLSQRYQKCLDDLTPFTIGRWVAAGLITIAFFARIFIMQGWYIVAYALGIYHLNLFIAFLTPKIDPALAMYEESESGPELPTRANEEFRPFIRRLPEFKFWHAVTKSTLIAFFCTFFELFNVPVFWPILVMYFFTLVAITMKRQIKHMIKYRYLPFTHGKPKYAGSNDGKGDAVIPLIPPIVAPVIPPLVVPTIPGDKAVK